MHGRFQHDQEWIRERPHVFARDHRGNAGQSQGRCRVDLEEFRVRMGRADDMGMQRATGDREIVRIASAP